MTTTQYQAGDGWLRQAGKQPLVVADSIVSSINGAQSPELKMLVATLLDQGEQALKGRSGAVRIWTRGRGV
jgi:hypothetical protein